MDSWTRFQLLQYNLYFSSFLFTDNSVNYWSLLVYTYVNVSKFVGTFKANHEIVSKYKYLQTTSQ